MMGFLRLSIANCVSSGISSLSCIYSFATNFMSSTAVVNSGSLSVSISSGKDSVIPDMNGVVLVTFFILHLPSPCRIAVRLLFSYPGISKERTKRAYTPML